MKRNDGSERLQREKAQIAVIWAKASKMPFRLLSRNIVREICSYLGRCQYLYMLAERKLLGFDVNNQKWTVLKPISSALEDTYRTAYAFILISPAVFLLCGGLTAPNKSCAHLIASDGAVLELEPMRTGRYAHAAIYLEAVNTVYVFGGANSGRLQETERFSLVSQHWKEGNLLKVARAGINPYLYCGLVYLCAGDSEGTIETFNWRTESTAVLPIRLPFSSTCITVRQVDSWVTISESKICHWQLDGSQQTKARNGALVTSTSPPIVHNEVLYLVCMECAVTVDLESGAEVARSSYLIGWKGV